MRTTVYNLLFGLLLAMPVYTPGQHLPPAPGIQPGGEDYLGIMADRTLRFDTTWHNAPAAERPEADDIPAWKAWALAGNYAFGRDRGNMPMIADLSALHPYFRDKVIQLIHLCRKKGIELQVAESFRTRAKQAEYYSMGAKYTRSAGGRSKHQYGLAVDLVPIVNGEAQWENKALWRRIGLTGESLGLRWGGRWRTIYDPAHFEWTGGVSVQHLAEGTCPPVPDPAQYPCLQEDLEQLRKYWDEWEVEQASLARGGS